MSPPDGPERSPDFLAGTGMRGAGGRRLNRVPLIIALVIGALVIGAIGYTYQQRLARRHSMGGSPEAQAPEPASAAPLFGSAPVAGMIPGTEPPPKEKPPPAPAPPAPVAAIPPIQPVDTGPRRAADPEAEARRRSWERYDEEVRRAEEQRRTALRDALTAATTISTGMPQAAAGVASPGGQGAPGPRAGTGSLFGRGGTGGQGIDGGPGGADPNGQQAKRDFLDQPTPRSHPLPNTREAPLSPYEIKAGTVIAGVMIGGIDSDLPGQIIGQVRENVYDTATGRHLLIPQGARLVGLYDNGVSMGQERVLIAWNRIIYPDGSSLDLGLMPGADQGGYAGFTDQVNNHYIKVFGNALLLSLFSAGIQLSQPQRGGGDGYDSQQIIAGALGQQLGQLGSEFARRGLNIAPTLEIRPGYLFNIMVTRDMILTPWQG
jgi:type IV secretion system protein TrbI